MERGYHLCTRLHQLRAYLAMGAAEQLFHMSQGQIQGEGGGL